MLDYRTYLGPYLQCQGSMVLESISRKTCTNNACKNQNGSMQSNFCEQCGSPVGMVKFSVKTNAISIWELKEEMKDMLTTPYGDFFSKLSKDGIHIWFGDHVRPNKDSRSFSLNMDMLAPIDTGVINSEIVEFVEQYKDAILVLKKAYGDHNVELKWGLVHHEY